MTRAAYSVERFLTGSQQIITQLSSYLSKKVYETGIEDIDHLFEAFFGDNIADIFGGEYAHLLDKLIINYGMSLEVLYGAAELLEARGDFKLLLEKPNESKHDFKCTLVILKFLRANDQKDYFLRSVDNILPVEEKIRGIAQHG